MFTFPGRDFAHVRFLKLFVLIFTLIFTTTLSSQAQTQGRNPTAQVLASPTPTPAPLPPPTVQIEGYRAAAARIIGAALTSDRAYERLSYLTDHIGHRLSAS